MAIKFLENVATTHFVSNSYDNIYAEHIKWLEIAEKEGPYQKNETKNQLKLSEVQLNFAKANNLFYKKKFQEALKTYQYVQGLVFQLLYPSFKPQYVFDSKLDIPLNAKLFDAILKVGSEMAVSLPPENIQSAVSYVSTKSLPEDVQKYAHSFDEAGVTTGAGGISNDVRNATMLGLEYAKSNEWNQAESFFKQGLEALGNASTPDAKIAKASIELNLGAVYTQKGNLDLAKRFVTSAGQGFKDSNDQIGEAQAKLNMAAILNKEGNGNEAAALSKEAETLLKAEDKMSIVTRGTNPSLTGDSASRLSSSPALSPTAVGTNGGLHASTFSNIALRNTAINPITIGTTTKPNAIFDLAAKNGGGVLFRLPNKGDGWTTQDLEGNIEKNQKIATKELGVK